MKPQQERFKIEHNIENLQPNYRTNKYEKKPTGEIVTICGMAYCDSDGETTADIDRLMWQGKDVLPLITALDIMEDFKEAAAAHAESVYCNYRMDAEPEESPIWESLYKIFSPADESRKDRNMRLSENNSHE